MTIIPGFFIFLRRQASGLNLFRSLRIILVFKLILKIIFSSKTVNIDEEGQYDKILELTEKNYDVKYEIFKIISHLISILFIATHLLVSAQEFTKSKKIILNSDGELIHIDFFQGLYFIIVTLTTLGYGDLLPGITEIRIFLAFLLIIFISFISQDIASLSVVLSNISAYYKNYGFKNHIVI